MDYTFIIEGSNEEGFGAYSPDVPGLAITAKTEALLRKRIESGLKFHFEMLSKAGDEIPQPTVKAYVQRIEQPFDSRRRRRRRAQGRSTGSR